MMAGFAMMAGRSSHAGVDIGEGAMAGMKYYQAQAQLDRAWLKDEAEIDNLGSELRYRDRSIDLEQQKLNWEMYKTKAQIAWANGDPLPPMPTTEGTTTSAPVVPAPKASPPAPAPAPNVGQAKPPVAPAPDTVTAPAPPNVVTAGPKKTASGPAPDAPAPAPAPNTAKPPNELAVPPEIAKAAQQPGPAPGVTWDQVIDEENPTKLSAAYEHAFKGASMGLAAPGLATDLLNRMNTLINAPVYHLKDGSTVVNPAIAEVERQKAAAGEGGKEMLSGDAEVADARETRGDARQRLELLLDLNDKIKTGALADSQAALSSYAQYFGVDPKTATNIQVFNKLATQEIYKELKEQKGSVRNMEIAGYTKQMASSELTSAANRKILLQAIGSADKADAYANDYFKWRGTPQGKTALTEGSFKNDWLADKGHGAQNFIDQRTLTYMKGHRPTEVPPTAKLQSDPSTGKARWFDKGSNQAWDFNGEPM